MIAMILALAFGTDPTTWLRAAQESFREANWREADRYFLMAHQEATLVDDRSTALEAMLGRVDLRLAAREPDSALNCLPASPGPGTSADDSVLWWSARARVLQAKGGDPGDPMETALSIARRASGRPLQDWCLLVRARIRTTRGDLDGAQSDLSSVHVGDSRILGLRLLQARCALELARGRPSDALALAKRAGAMAREQGDVSSAIEILPLRAKAEEAVGDLRAAKASWEAARATAGATGLDHQAKEARAALERLGQASP